MVVHLGGPAPPAQANFFGPRKRTQSTLAGELNIRAADALEEARKMPPGDERAEAMQKATILENAAEMLEHLGVRSACRQNDGRESIPSRSTVNAS